jgi:hypothetical protein
MLSHLYGESEKEITDNLRTRFLLAQLLMDSFRDKLTIRDVKSALQKLPQGSDAYDIAYSTAMERIFAQGEGPSKMAKKILAWILCAHRPLSTLELLHALAVEPGDNEIDEDNILEAEQLLTICAGLVTIDEQSDNVRFIHYTTQEYLQRNQQMWLPHAEIEIARSCTAYLSIDGLPVGPCSSEVDYKSRLKKFVLLEYAALYWGPHLNLLMQTNHFDISKGVGAEALSLLLDTKRLSVMSQVLFMSKRIFFSWETVREEGEGFSGSHWTGRFGLLPLLQQWIDKKYEIDQRDLSGRTPLSWAAENRQEVIVKLLLNTAKVDVDSKDNNDQTPLSWATHNGHEAIAKLLLDTDVKITHKVLVTAARHYERGVQLLQCLLDAWGDELEITQQTTEVIARSSEYRPSVINFLAERSGNAISFEFLPSYERMTATLSRYRPDQGGWHYFHST